MADLARLSLNTVTLRDQYSLAQCIEACARHGIPGIAPWRDALAELGLAQAVRRIRDAGLRVSSLCRGGLFGGAGGTPEENRRAIHEAHALGADCLVMVAGGLPPGSKNLEGARSAALDGLAALLPLARAAGVRLGLEPLHPMTAADRSVLCTAGQALDWVAALGDGVGLVLDAYHVWWDPGLDAALARASGVVEGGLVCGFHVDDWLVPTTDTVFDRGMMGDGVIDLPALRRGVDGTGYAGMIEVEILSRRWWRHDPDALLTSIRERFRDCC